MFPGMNPRDMQKAMKKLGIKQEEIDASEVIIKCEGKNIIIKNPQVSKVNMMGHDSFQIAGGDIEETSSSQDVEINEEDVQTVVSQTGCSRERAADVLKELNGNIAEAIMSIKNEE